MFTFSWRTTSMRVGGQAAGRSCLPGPAAATVDSRRGSLVWCGGVNIALTLQVVPLSLTSFRSPYPGFTRLSSDDAPGGVSL